MQPRPGETLKQKRQRMKDELRRVLHLSDSEAEELLQRLGETLPGPGQTRAPGDPR